MVRANSDPGSGMETTAGYSGRPLALKLGLDQVRTVLLVDAPPEYPALVGAAFENLDLGAVADHHIDLAHVFVTTRTDLARRLGELRRELRPDAAVWVSWPKKASKVPTDVSEDVIREIALPLGFVDNKVCAVSDVWSGLRLVVRRELR